MNLIHVIQKINHEKKVLAGKMYCTNVSSSILTRIKFRKLKTFTHVSLSLTGLGPNDYLFTSLLRLYTRERASIVWCRKGRHIKFR